jgi:hypothetical protein
MPITAAATMPTSTSLSAPIPMATIDSPSAMMTIRPWRSAKWCGTSRHPSAPKKYCGAASSTRASAQNANCSVPSANDASTSSVVPSAVLTARP